MDKRTIFVTGAASGIGQATARLFTRKGWSVGLFDVDEAGLRSLAQEIGPGALRHVLDVGDIQAFRRAVAVFAERFGRMDVLFNCAGLMRMGPFASVPWEDHARTVRVNVLGVVNGIHASLDLLKKTPGARVVTMGSASAIYGVPDLATYSASKFFVRGLTEALSLELEPEGIVVTDLMPLYVRTPMITGQPYRAGSLETFGARLSPEEVAEIVFRAVHRRRVHWIPGALLKLLDLSSSLFPFARRPVMRFLGRRRG